MLNGYFTFFSLPYLCEAKYNFLNVSPPEERNV